MISVLLVSFDCSSWVTWFCCLRRDREGMKTSRRDDTPRVKQSLMLLSSRERRGGNSLNSLVVSVVSVALDRKFRSFERRKILASALFVSMISSNSVNEKKKIAEERRTVRSSSRCRDWLESLSSHVFVVRIEPERKRQLLHQEQVDDKHQEKTKDCMSQ